MCVWTWNELLGDQFRALARYTRCCGFSIMRDNSWPLDCIIVATNDGMVGINLRWYTLSLMLFYNEPNHKWCGILKGKLRVFDGVIFWGNTFHYLFQEGMMKLHLPKVKVLNIILHSDSWSVLLYIHPDMYGLLWWLQMPVCVHVCVCVCMHMYTSTYIRMYVCMYVCMCICYVCMYDIFVWKDDVLQLDIINLYWISVITF